MIKKEKSFTLLELITATVIVSILLTIFLPKFIKNIAKSRQVEAIDILTRMYKGYRIALIDEVIDSGTVNFVNGTVFNPDESDILPNNPTGRSDLSWKALGFPQNINYKYNNLYFSYDFIKVGEQSNDRSDCLGTRPTASGAPWAIAYRKRSNTWVTGTELFPVNYDQRIYIYMNNGTIVKSADYQ